MLRLLLAAGAATAALSGEGYQSTRWGMSVAQVKALYPNSVDAAEAKKIEPKLDTKGDFVFAETTLRGKKAYATFTFTKGALSEAVVRPETEKSENCGTLLDAYEEKYGAAKTHDKSDDANLFRLHAVWDRPETVIDLECDSVKTKAGAAALSKLAPAAELPEKIPGDSVRVLYKKKQL